MCVCVWYDLSIRVLEENKSLLLIRIMTYGWCVWYDSSLRVCVWYDSSIRVIIHKRRSEKEKEWLLLLQHSYGWVISHTHTYEKTHPSESSSIREGVTPSPTALIWIMTYGWCVWYDSSKRVIIPKSHTHSDGWLLWMSTDLMDQYRVSDGCDSYEWVQILWISICTHPEESCTDP